MILCHRGITKHYPENTLGSIKNTLESDLFDGIEIDVQLTFDNKWIIYHDDNLKRLNGIDKKVNKTNYNDIGSIKWKEKYFNVNTLDELLSLYYPDKTIDIEIKTKFNMCSPDNLNNLLKIIKKINTKKFISSFDHKWFYWCNENNFEFACIFDKKHNNLNNLKQPLFGYFWIINSDNFIDLDISDIIEKNIKIGIYGKYIKNDFIKVLILDYIN